MAFDQRRKQKPGRKDEIEEAKRVVSRRPDIIFHNAHGAVDGPDYLFKPKIEGNIMYGRGVCDVKSSAVLMMHLMKEFSQKNQ